MITICHNQRYSQHYLLQHEDGRTAYARNDKEAARKMKLSLDDAICVLYANSAIKGWSLKELIEIDI